MKRIIFLLIPSILLAGAVNLARAQQDTLAGMRLFIKVCNDYKQLPVQVDLEIGRSSNLVAGPADTGHIRAKFYLQHGGSYVEMDGMEQIVNDSVMLLVSKRSKRMIAYANRQSVAMRLKQYLGVGQMDSTLAQLAGRYRVFSPGRDRDTLVIELKSRATVQPNSLPQDEISVRYDSASCRPYEVTELRRKLVPVNDSVYKALSGRPEFVGKLVTIHDTSRFLVKEQVSVFRYRGITHNAETALPAKVSDRIVAGVAGKYQPVKTYADFVLTQQF